MSTESTTKKTLAGDWPDFITTEDLAQADELEHEVKRLVEHRESVTRDPVKKKFDDAQAAYCASSTDKNFGTFKAAAKELMIVESQYYGRVRTAVHDAIRSHLIDARFFPWASAILERGLEASRTSLANVIASEEAHHQEAAGEPLGQRSNAIIEKARLPVRELEGVLLSIKPGGDRIINENVILAFLKFLRARASKGTAD